jgi:hypothetical protein
MRFTFVILLFCCLGADAQMIIKAHANYRPMAVAAQNLLLDDYPNAAAAYSLRKLRTAYTGNAIRVRRSNDNSEQDIGFTSAGDLDTASLKTFVGANSGFVTTWYNQGDSASLDFTQTTAASQPRIINAGTIDRRNGDPSIFFDGSNDFMDVASSTATYSFLHKIGQKAIFVVTQQGTASNPNVAYAILNNNGLSLNSSGYGLFYDDRSSVPRNNAIGSQVGINVVSNVADNFFTPNQLNLITNLMDNNNATFSLRSSLYYNSGNLTQNNSLIQATQTGNASNNMRMGRISNGTTFTMLGYMSEIIIYPSNQSSNRPGIETNINLYYGIY